MCEMQVYIQDDRQRYVVSIRLGYKGEFKGCHLALILITVNKDKLIFPGQKFIPYVDHTRQCY